MEALITVPAAIAQTHSRPTSVVMVLNFFIFLISIWKKKKLRLPLQKKKKLQKPNKQEDLPESMNKSLTILSLWFHH